MRNLITSLTVSVVFFLVACGAEVRFTPASAQDGPGGAGGSDTTTAAGGASGGAGGSATCDCPPPRLVELERAECVGEFAVFDDNTYPAFEFRNRGFVAWVHPTADETLSQEPARLEWSGERGLFARCPIGEEMTVTLWGME